MAKAYDVVVVTATSDHTVAGPLVPNGRRAAGGLRTAALRRPRVSPRPAAPTGASRDRSVTSTSSTRRTPSPTGSTARPACTRHGARSAGASPAPPPMSSRSQLNRPGRATLFTYDTGDTLVDGSAAPDRRVGLFVTRSSDSRLDATGRALVVRSVDGLSTGVLPSPRTRTPHRRWRPVILSQRPSVYVRRSSAPRATTASLPARPSRSPGPVRPRSPSRTLARPRRPSRRTAPGYVHAHADRHGRSPRGERRRRGDRHRSERAAEGSRHDRAVLGQAPLSVTFDATTSIDGDGTIVSYAWNFGDGSDPVVRIEPTTAHTYGATGTFTVSLTVTDDDGASDSVTSARSSSSPT